MDLKTRGYEIEIDAGDILELEEKMLESGLCSFTVPMWFSRQRDKLKITYDCSGYISLRDMNLKRSSEVLEILEKTFLTLNKSWDFFIPPENISLSLDTVFFNAMKRKIKIAYVPTKDKRLHYNINGFLDDMVKNVNEDTKEYLAKVKSDLNNENKNLRDIASFINEQRRALKISKFKEDGMKDLPSDI